MHVWRGYRQIARLWRSPQYVLDMRVDVSAEELGVIIEHVLWGDEVYVGAASLAAEAAAESALDLANETTDRGKGLRLRLRGIFHTLVLARLEARLTVGQALEGRSFVASDVIELVAIENGVLAGLKALESKLAKLGQFEIADEHVTEPAKKEEGFAPADWPRARR